MSEQENSQLLINRLWQVLNVPDTCLLNTRIYKKMLLDNTELTAKDKKLINDVIDAANWRYTLKPETINIPSYQTEALDYPEIAIIHISLKSDKQTKRLMGIIQRVIPYPLLIVVNYKNNIWFNLANKRQSLADSHKLTIEESFDSEWINEDSLTDIEEQFIQSLVCKEFDWTNMYCFYQSMVQRLLAFQTAQYTDEFVIKKQLSVNENNKNDINQQAQLTKIKSIEQQQNQLKVELKKESQFNEKLNLNMRIKQYQQQIEQLTQEL
ncbi:MAG: DUF4391 domain-containing protein [Methylococcales bacterium]